MFGSCSCFGSFLLIKETIWEGAAALCGGAAALCGTNSLAWTFSFEGLLTWEGWEEGLVDKGEVESGPGDPALLVLADKEGLVGVLREEVEELPNWMLSVTEGCLVLEEGENWNSGLLAGGPLR